MRRHLSTAGTFTLALALALGASGVLVSPDAAPAYGDGSGDGAKSAAAAEKEKWREHMGDLPFIVGYEKGMREVEFTGRPPMYFFTATW